MVNTEAEAFNIAVEEVEEAVDFSDVMKEIKEEINEAIEAD